MDAACCQRADARDASVCPCSLETLKKARDFDRVFRQGRTWSGPEFSVILYRRQRGQGRVGFCVSKKLGGAVQRNRLRRRLREVYRLSKEKLAARWDLVILARSLAMTATYRQLEELFLQLARKAQILREPGPSEPLKF